MFRRIHFFVVLTLTAVVALSNSSTAVAQNRCSGLFAVPGAEVAESELDALERSPPYLAKLEEQIERSTYGRELTNLFAREVFVPQKLYTIENGNYVFPRLTLHHLRKVLRDEPIEGWDTTRIAKSRYLKSFAAILIGRAFEPLKPGQPYPEKRLRFEASLLGVKTTNLANAYRFERRTPAEIIQARGFLPNPASPFHTLWEHVQAGKDSGTLISTTYKEMNPTVLFMVAKARRYNRTLNLGSTGSTTVYEYRIQNVEGLITPPQYGAAPEKEFILPAVPLEKITHWREITIDRDRMGGTVSKLSEWQTLR